MKIFIDIGKTSRTRDKHHPKNELVRKKLLALKDSKNTKVKVQTRNVSYI